jgi:hypothetical protein
VEEVLAKNKFLPALFGEPLEADDGRHHELACLPVKHVGLATPDLTDTSTDCYAAHALICAHLTAAV